VGGQRALKDTKKGHKKIGGFLIFSVQKIGTGKFKYLPFFILVRPASQIFLVLLLFF
jgi:hypothetical protein